MPYLKKPIYQPLFIFSSPPTHIISLFQKFYYFSSNCQIYYGLQNIIINIYRENNSRKDQNMQPNTLSFLQQKQEYLRNHISVQQYQDFYQFCQSEVGNVDVNAWTMPFVQNLVSKYSDYKTKKLNSPGDNQHQRTYNQYQSIDADKKIQNINNFNDDDCKSSRVMKSSAVDLLDQAFERTSLAESNYTNSHKNNSLGFEQFDFWTNGCLTPTEPKMKNNSDVQTRQKSYTQTEMMKTHSYQPSSQYNKPTHNQNRNSAMISSSSQFNTERNSYFGDGVDLFMMPEKKKQSPYMKKQTNVEPYNARGSMIKPEKKEEPSFDFLGIQHQKIRIKEVKPINEESTISKETSEIPKGKWILQQKVFHQQIPCFKSTQRSQLNHPNLNISIDDKYEIIQRSFLAADYPMYKLKVVPVGTQCKRNYDDFSKLNKTLTKFFPGMHLAFLEDGSWFSGTDEAFIEKQKKMIEMFMRDLLRNKQIRNSRVMEDFLTLQDHKSMKRKFQKYQKMAELKGIEELCVLDGKVDVTISSQQTNYINNLTYFINKMDDYYQRHQRLTESLSKQYLHMMQTMNSLIRLMSNIQRQIKAFNKKVTTNQIKYLGNVYKILKETYKEDLSSLKFQHEIYEKKISPFLRYEHENMLGLNKILEMEKKFSKYYEKRSLNEKVQYGEDYNSEKARHGKKGITEESRNILVLKYQVGYFGHQSRVEGERVFNEMGYKMLNRWQSLAQSYLDRYTKNIEYRKNLLHIDKQKYLPVAC